MTPLSADDLRALDAILTAIDDRDLVRQIHAYWRDADRADRTPRSMLYLHLGLLSGLCAKLLQIDLPVSALTQALLRGPQQG